MIERMKKVTVLTRTCSQETTLEGLRELGVLHLVHVGQPAGDAVETLRGQLQTLEMATRLVSKKPRRSARMHHVKPHSVPRGVGPENGLKTAQELIECHESLRENESELDDLHRQCEALRPLGQFDPREVVALRESGVTVRVLVGKPEALRRASLSDNTRIVGREGKRVYVAIIQREQNSGTGIRPIQCEEDRQDALSCFKEFKMPEESLTELEHHIAALEERRKEIGKHIDELSGAAGEIANAEIEVRNRLEFEQARAGMGGEEEVCYLRGFCPAPRLRELTDTARKHGWALWITEPAEDDPVPTLLRNTRWSALFQPVMRFLGVTPGYREFDTNGLFLVFFALFFAMIVGDAGYGLLMLGATLAASRFWPKFTRPAMLLFLLLSVATIVWGAVTGTWFGVRQIAGWPLLSALVVPGLDAFAGTQDNLIRICLLLGAVHLTIARIWLALRRRSVRSLADAGWAMIVWGFYLFALRLLLDEQHPRLLVVLLGVGGLLVLLCEEQSGEGLFRGAWRGLVHLPLTLLNGVGSFSDVVSYIRLFAVGLATTQVAVAFNDMAAAVGTDSVVAVLGSSLIVLLGHGLNLLLAALGVLVHGVRLNLLEFSKHLEVSWSGVPYAPFRLEGNQNFNSQTVR